MGGHPYWYLVPYKKNVKAALDELREREFKAGRYNPVIRIIEFTEPAFSRQQPGSKHKTIKAAMKAAAEEGTRSILDISEISSTPEYCAANPLAPETIRDLYGTDKPSRAMLLEEPGYLEGIERGMCIYTFAYEHGAPTEILFAGYSYD